MKYVQSKELKKILHSVLDVETKVEIFFEILLTLQQDAFINECFTFEFATGLAIR